MAVAASLLAHAGFLALLLSSANLPSGARPARAVDVRIIPDFMGPSSPGADRTATPARKDRAADRPSSAGPAAPAHAGEQAVPSPPPSADQPLATADAAPPSEGPSGAGPPLTALRSTIGCRSADFLQLSSAERQHCRDRFAAATPGAPTGANLGIDPIKKAAFDASWKADHSEQHMAGLGCLATFGWHGLKWAHPSEGVKLGSLPCYVYTPKATFSVDPPPARGW